MSRTPILSRVRWSKTYRIIPSRFPPIDAFERVIDPSRSVLLGDLEGLTNARLRQEWGDISLVPPERRVFGPGASWVMAPFAHFRGRPTRFSDGTYGVYYAGREIETAIAETVHHMGLFYAATSDAPHREDVRTLIGSIDARLHDLRTGTWRRELDPDDYGAAQALGRRLRDAASPGIVYPSVRRAGGQAVAVFWPDVVGIPVQGPHFAYHWDGARIDKVFDYRKEAWTDVGA